MDGEQWQDVVLRPMGALAHSPPSRLPHSQVTIQGSVQGLGCIPSDSNRMPSSRSFEAEFDEHGIRKQRLINLRLMQPSRPTAWDAVFVFVNLETTYQKVRQR